MTPPRESFIVGLRVRHASPNTVEMYVKVIEEFSKFHDKSPLAMVEEDVQTFLFHCVNIRQFSPATTNLYISAMRSFYEIVDPLNPIMNHFRKLHVEKKIPHILSMGEVIQIINAVPTVKYRAALAVMYSGGLRIHECLTLEPQHIDRSRMAIRVENGKGNKDRYTILSSRALSLLEQHYRMNRPQRFLFEGRDMRPMCDTSVSTALKNAAVKVGINRPVYPHLLRHCFATHLLERGVELEIIQKMMGHRYISTTAHYAHITPEMLRKVVSPLDSLSGGHHE